MNRNLVRTAMAFGLTSIGALTLACADRVDTPAPAPAPASSAIVAAPPTTTTPPAGTPTGGVPLMPGEDPGYDAPPGTPTQPPYTPGGTPTPTPSPYPGTGSACSVQTGVQSCDVCLMQACCAQVAACDADPTCGQVDQCAAQCYQQYANNPQVEQQCEQQCYAARPSGAQRLDALYQCMDQACVGQCPQ